MKEHASKELLEEVRPKIAKALSALKVPRSDCEIARRELDHYDGWELLFTLRLRDDEQPGDSGTHGYFVVRVSTDPFFDGMSYLHFALFGRDGQMAGGAVPPYDLQNGDEGLVKFIRYLLNEFDPERYPSPIDDDDDEDDE
jgi:hypothetical protein